MAVIGSPESGSAARPGKPGRTARPGRHDGSAQHIGHGVDDTLLLRGDPFRRHDRSAHEDLPGMGLMAQFDALGVADEHHGVVADDVAASDRVYSYFFTARGEAAISLVIIQ